MGFVQHIKLEINKWNRNIKLFFLANIFYQIGSGIFSVLYNLYIQSLGYSETMNGSIVSIQSLATALMFIPIGFIGDRSSRKRLLIIGSLLTGLTFVGRAFAEAELSMQLLAIGSGIFVTCFQVLAVPFLAENVSKEYRLKFFSYHFSMVLAAQVLGSLGGGFIADILESIGWEQKTSLQTILMIGGIASIIAFLPLLFVTESKSKEQADHQSKLEMTEYKPLTANTSKSEWKTIAQLTLIQLIIGIGSGLVIPYLNLYFVNRFNVNLTMVGLLISLGQVMTIISMMIGPMLVNRVGQVRAVICFQLLSLPFLILTGYTNLLIIASISFLFRQALMNAANPITSSIMVERVSDARRGIVNSLTQAAFMMGWASMGTVQSYFVTTYGSYWGYAITFSITGVLYITAASLFYIMFGSKTKKHTRPVEMKG
ncbi:MFS transporter [Paenibacillus albiflavus]|uniref:MFS transporter n=1 Tax=Paenibacillus albiflavus TaxID=2545760 RepID=A0A4R4E323_9BACL|nr:MFS transporter [Paenibacillus albiflavus]TCZ73193.1 MFS transporter [Paenibacillus albiflavus]